MDGTRETSMPAGRHRTEAFYLVGAEVTVGTLNKF